jgi:hypothetical protein
MLKIVPSSSFFIDLSLMGFPLQIPEGFYSSRSTGLMTGNK